LGGNSGKINKKFDYYIRLGGYDRTRGSHDDRRNVDAAISDVHDKSKTTRRCSGGQEDNSKIESVRRVGREIIQEKYYRHFTALCNTPGRASNIERHTRRSMWPSF
jgi:hypothetical protein